MALPIDLRLVEPAEGLETEFLAMCDEFHQAGEAR